MDHIIEDELRRQKCTLEEQTNIYVTLKYMQDGIGSAPEIQEKGRIPILPDKVKGNHSTKCMGNSKKIVHLCQISII